MMTTAAKGGYWVEPFLQIVRGNEKLKENEFTASAEILFSHRLKGNIWRDSDKEREIKELFVCYQDLQDVTDLEKRAKLLTTVFMQTLAVHNKDIFSPESKKYIIEKALPSSLEACNALDLLTIDSYRTWITGYLFGCLKPETIDAQVKSTEGLTPEQEKAFIEERKRIAMSWYVAFTNGQVSLEDVKQIINRIKNRYLTITNPIMERAYNEYNALAATLPAHKTEDYWKAIIASLTAFVDKAHPAKT